MRPLSSIELLQAWEHAGGLPPAERALPFLAAACDDAPDDPAQCPLGERDARLLLLREWIFGDEAAAIVRCPACSESMEVGFKIRDLRVSAPMPPREPLALMGDGYEVRFRLPNSADLRGLRTDDDGMAADPRTHLLTRCVLEVRRGGHPIQPSELPEGVRDAISCQMAEADPQAQVVLNFKCAGCATSWREDFHIDSFFWAEIQAWAGRMINEVHQLACAYGWSEEQILRMSPWRRSLYLNLIAE